jgi:zona occludens toxin
MAIHVITGTPGAGKTLRALYMVEALRKESGRDVYYNGINDLMLPWIIFDDPKKWHVLPDKSVIVIDEAQRAFRPRAASVQVPDFVEALETHRHRGIDIYMITQHPLMLEQNVRRLAESHEHLMRKFGSKWATVHVWKGIKENCDKSRSDSQSSEFVYPKEVFTWYKSAEAHTHKFKLPFKVKVLIAVPFLIAGCVYLAMKSIGNLAKPPAAVVSSASAGTVAAGGGLALSLPVVDPFSPRAVEQYIAQYQPRIKGLPWTSPRYDELTLARVVPVIRGCVMLPLSVATDVPRTFCILDGGVRVYPPVDFVRQFIRDGFFIDFETTRLDSFNGGVPQRAGDLAAQQPRAGDVAARAQGGSVPVSAGVPSLPVLGGGS